MARDTPIPRVRLRGMESKLHKFKNNKTKTCLHKLINKSIPNVNVVGRGRQRHEDKFKYITGGCELQISQSSHSFLFERDSDENILVYG